MTIAVIGICVTLGLALVGTLLKMNNTLGRLVAEISYVRPVLEDHEMRLRAQEQKNG